MEYDEVVARLEALANPTAVAGMARYAIGTTGAYGVSLPELRSLAREIGHDHQLALQLWESNSRETRILATLVDDTELVGEEQVERWVVDFDNWEVCDQCCMNLMGRLPFAYAKAAEWSSRDQEFVKRAGFVLMARLAVGDKKAPDEKFVVFLPIIAREAKDGRNFVKKAVNWALRQIGKRNLALNELALATARQIQQQDSTAARWVAADAIRELSGDYVQQRLRGRAAAAAKPK